MKKRIISALMALVLILSVCAVGSVGASAEGNTAIIRVGGVDHAVAVGDFVEYRMSFLYTGSNLATAQVEVPINFDGLSGYTKSELSTYLNRIAPNTASGSVVERFDGDGTLGLNGYVMNFVSAGGYNFRAKKVVLSLILGVEKAGTYDIGAKIRYVEDVNDHVAVDGSYRVLDNRFHFYEELTDVSLDTPQLNVSTYAGGMMVKWDPVPRAALYRVYRKNNNSWTRIKDTAETSYIDPDVTSGNRYTYTVRCINASATKFTSDFDRAGKSAVYYTAPILRTSSAENGILLQWDAVPQAAKYRLYYRNYQGGWSRLTDDVTGTSFLDRYVNPGASFIYTIRALDARGNVLSWFYPDGFRGQYIEPPVISLSNVEDGVKISWEKPKGSVKYRAYYRNSKGGWTRLGDTTDNYFIDKEVSSNYTYTYTVRCINESATAFTSYFHAGKSIRYYAAPVLKPENAANGVNLKWNAIPGASKYRLYYRNYQGGWSRLTSDLSGTSFLDRYVNPGTAYTYTIRALDANGNVLSWFYPDGFTIRYIEPPVVSLSNVEDGVKISWEKPKGSTKYRVYYRNSKGGWTRLGDTTDNYFIDKDVLSNRTYTYTVRCINDSATAFTSFFLDGKSIKYYAAPKLQLNNTASGVSVKWNAIEGASQYRLYYKSGSSWTKVVDTAGTSYLDRNVKVNTAYTYTIRAMDANGRAISWFYPDGFTITYKK
ncbi:hypothetical protein [Ruminococcus sp.]|uniref:hypothetical protein n=1 Tax=Ruminococcus sp. TaxID=41978 RepID=UPI003890FE12